MQEFVFFINGDVHYPLTIDPTVWIFDERKVDLDTYFDEEIVKEDEELAYTKAISAQWDKEIIEGASPPPNPNSNQNEIKYEKQKLIKGSFGMPLKPFLDHTEPLDSPESVKIILKDGTHQILPYSVVQNCIVGFSNQGATLKNDGPVHIYLGDGTNREHPIKNVVEFIIQKKSRDHGNS